MPMVTCPKGHASSDPDFCDECGIRIPPAGTQGPAPATAAGADDTCPDCATPRTPGSRFCEVCRHDFASGMATMPPPKPAPTAASAQAIQPAPASSNSAAAPQRGIDAPIAPMRNPWVVVRCDRAMIEVPAGTDFPENEPERAYPLDLDETKVGRRNGRHGNDIDLVDPAASARHLVMSRRPDGGLYVTDLNSSNGTTVRGTLITPGVPALLGPGDVVTLGAFTRITIEDR